MGVYIFVSVLVLIACVFQILVVLVQNSKGGGLAANFTSAGQTMGIRKTADFLEKATWTLAASILVLSVLATATIPRQEREVNPRTSIDAAANPNAIPTLPTAVPPASSQPEEGGQPQN
ncbi:MAG TPA: preprotein translocase subunit SecG [Bacteroidales bacterium]|nr:preprotein translocase subunit SecG [Bacteroidales bacterium]HPF02327.1 preprotein translocase subunit SecG [Bacteroidales bacterium]HPJ58172.1 preprotein translocase subunit SecG [Bacteroidales bacterium]HPR11503.1 preprotein translocase subunit SecG [Bacteroidales bacterium]HRW84245.1 preprotein translocase subunit SecG [Bacteroidales bacterium]